MTFILHLWQLLLVILADWVSQQQQQILEFQRTEIDVLKEKLGKRRVLLNDDQRRRLAVKGEVLGRKVLLEIGRLFTTDTILRWHRELVAPKWDYSGRRKKKPGRQVLSGVPGDPEDRGRGGGPSASKEPEPELAPGAVSQVAEARVPGKDDLLR